MSCYLGIDFSSPAWESIPGDHRSEIHNLITSFHTAPVNGLVAWMKSEARALGIEFPTYRRKFYEWRNTGGDWTSIVDHRRATAHRAAKSKARQPVFIAELLRLVEKHQRNNSAAFRALRLRWQSRRHPIPGYEDWEGWPKIPAGWGERNLARIVKDNSNIARIRSVRVGTSSKTNPYLPHVLTTRVGLHPGAVIQIDDVWHDNLVTLGKRRELVRVIELGALDLFSACRFHFGAKPRRKRENGTWETIGMQDTRMFLAGMFHRIGYAEAGTSIMSEHQTAKVEEDIARILYDATRGRIRVEYQPIEGKQSALCGFWNGTEGGNFRAKAALESIHNLIHNDLAALPMQTGSPSSGLQGPVTTDRIAAHINRVVRDVLANAPHHLDALRLPTLDFHSQFYPLLSDYYHVGLNGRTDHDLEGWEALGHVINEYTLSPGSDQFIAEDLLLKLPAPSQLAIREAARENPSAWSRRRKLSPAEVWNKRTKFLPIPPIVLCDILGRDLGREITARRGFLEFSDITIAPDPLVYQARFVSGPRNGQEIHHGEKLMMFALPFDDSTAMVVDASFRFLGEVPLYKRVTPINTDAFHTSNSWETRPDLRSEELTRAAGEKHERIAAILEPSRILHREEVAEARDIREHNRKVVSGEPVTPEEIAASLSAAAAKAASTRRVNQWADEMPEDLPADLMQPDCTTPAESIPDEQIASWLND